MWNVERNRVDDARVRGFGVDEVGAARVRFRVDNAPRPARRPPLEVGCEEKDVEA